MGSTRNKKGVAAVVCLASSAVIAESGNVVSCRAAHPRLNDDKWREVAWSIRGGGSPLSGRNSTAANFRREKDGSDDDDSNNKKKKKNTGRGIRNRKKGKEPTSSAADRSSSNESPAESRDAKKEELTGIPARVLAESNHYSILGLSPSLASSYTAAHIQKAYRQRALLTHPDKLLDNDRRAFDKVAKAYDVLGHHETRALYDRYGDDAGPSLDSPRTSRGFAGGVQDQILRSFFGTSPFSESTNHRQSFVPKNRVARYQLEVTLQDLYTGATKEVFLSPPSSPFYRQQQQQQQVRKKVQVHIPPGKASGSTIRLSGQIDFQTDSPPADALFILSQRPHDVFTRRGNDLALEITVTLKEALLGLNGREIVHLDGRLIRFSSPDDGNILRTGDIHVLKGEGMPKRGGTKTTETMGELNDDSKRCQEYGDLYIQYKVDLPSPSHPSKLKNEKKHVMTVEEKAEFGRLLDKLLLSSSSVHNNVNTLWTKKKSIGQYNYVVRPASLSDFGRASGVYNDDDDDNNNNGEDHLYNNEEEEYSFQSPFEKEGFHFFSSPFGSSRSQFRFDTNNHHGGTSGFYQNDDNDDDDGNGNVQCQQM